MATIEIKKVMNKTTHIQSTDKNAVANFTEVVSMIRHTHHEVMHLANKAIINKLVTEK